MLYTARTKLSLLCTSCCTCTKNNKLALCYRTGTVQVPCKLQHCKHWLHGKCTSGCNSVRESGLCHHTSCKLHVIMYLAYYCQFSISCGIWWVMSVRVNCWNLLSPVWRVLWIPFKNEMHTVYVLNTEIPKGDVKRLSSAPIVLWSTTILCCLTFRPAFRLVFCPTFRLALCVLCVNGWLHLEESIPL